MAVLKEFRCKAHGAFEEFVKGDKTPKCPRGCSPRFVTREFRTAPAIRGAATGRLDGLQKDLAHDFGLSDMKSRPDDGKSVMENLRSGTDFSTRWVGLPQAKAGWSQRGEKPANTGASALGMMDGNALAGAALPKDIPTSIQGSYKGD
jgi:hypothetical protein